MVVAEAAAAVCAVLQWHCFGAQRRLPSEVPGANDQIFFWSKIAWFLRHHSSLDTPSVQESFAWANFSDDDI